MLSNRVAVQAALQRLEPNEGKLSSSVLRGVRNSNVTCLLDYVSCERVFNPKLKDSAVIVLSNNDGCAVARSEEAKTLGIEAAVPAFAIKELIEKHNVAVFSSNYTLYGDMSERVMEVLRGFAPYMEVYSIDE